MSWWDPQKHADRRPLLSLRGQIKAGLRAWFEAQNFTEVECGILAASPGNEAHLHAFATGRVRSDDSRETLYLHTSPEFAAKKLLTAGETRIFEFARVFRNRERTRLHAPEFTMLEWYRAGENVEAVMDDTVALVRRAAEIAGGKHLIHRDRICDPFAEAERLSVADAFRIHAGIEILDTLDQSGNGDRDRACDPFAEVERLSVADAFRIHAGIEILDTLDETGNGNRDLFATRAKRAGFSITAEDGWSDIFSKVLAAAIEPRLGQGRLTLLVDYPRIEAALARPKVSDPRLSERFELYACGVELANGFGELTDPVEQRKRFETEMAEKERIYGERYPLDDDFLTALGHMPAASGVALGFDRLVMLAAGAPQIDDVLWTPLPPDP